MVKQKLVKMKSLKRMWHISLIFGVTSSMMLLICAGSLSSDTPSCFNLNVFSFWKSAQNPQTVCIESECSNAPYELKKNSNDKTRAEDMVHLGVVACGERLEETLVMIKSAIILSNVYIHLHLFADEDLRPKFKAELDSWPSQIQKKLHQSIYPITYPKVKNAADWIKLFKPCATQRLFIPYVVPENVTNHMLYVDTDILFMRPIEHIWNFFKRFNSSHIAALAPEHEWDRQGWYNRFARHPYYGRTGVNSGIMLMDMSRMRQINWIDHMIDYHAEYRFKITWGDQDLINIFFHYYPDKLYVYPCHWNFRPDHCMYGLNCEQAKKCGVSIVHGNRGVYHNEKQVVFKAIYKSIKDFEFGEDVKGHLLSPMKQSIKDLESSGYCGRAGNVFTKQLERQIKLRDNQCSQDPLCDPYEVEDFGLEENPKNEINPETAKVKSKSSDKTAQEPGKESQVKKKASPVVDEKSNKPKQDVQTKEKNEFVIQNIKSSLIKTFPAIEKKLLPILKEHMTRLVNARNRHVKADHRPEENVDSALLSPALHEDILGYLQSFKEMQTSDDYLKTLKSIIETLESSVSVEKVVHLVVVACGDRLEEPIVMMKSAILLSQNFLHFHVFAEEHLQPQFQKGLQLWPADLQKKFKLHIHDIQYPKDNANDWKKLFKKCATQRLFLPDILRDVDSVIYVDTDILFLRPIDDLWARFSEFNSTHISGLAPEHEDAHVSWYRRFARHPYYPPLGVNSGVMLMNLTRMRQAKWLDYIVPYFHTYRYNTTWGDQDLINIFFHFFPEKLYIFPCDWNYRQDHCMYMHVCKRAEEHGVSILHGARQVYHNEKEMAFRQVYEAIRDYPFGQDMKKHLIEKIRGNVNKHANTNCGKVGWVLSKQYEEQVVKKQKNTV